MVIAVLPPGAPSPREVDWEGAADGPATGLRVAWVGHSLMNARDSHLESGANVIEMVGRFAEAKGGTYAMTDHTLFGAPLSLLWQGHPHSYTRDEPQMVEGRRDLLEGEHDALVATEGIPVDLSRAREHSSYYLQRFYCEFLERNPDGRVYVYESWVHLQGSDPEAEYLPAHQWTWTDQLRFARPGWDALADEAMTGAVVGPSISDRFNRFLGDGEGCEPTAPIFLIPVATAMRALAERLEEAHRWSYQGRPLTAADLMLNPYAAWPEGWPTEDPLSDAEVAAALEALPLRHPDEELDDVHPSNLGVYFASLVSYATLYRQSPVGLPTVGGLPESTARGLQELVWQVVVSEPRTGVRAE